MLQFFRSSFPLILTALGLYIAYKQYLINKQASRISRQKLNLDLFEKRYRIYHLIKEILLEISQTNTIDLNKLRDFKFSIRDRIFLFERDINDYIDTIIKNAIDITHSTEGMELYSKNIDNLTLWTEYSNKQMEGSRWFSNEYQSGIEDRFMKYLNFKKVL